MPCWSWRYCPFKTTIHGLSCTWIFLNSHRLNISCTCCVHMICLRGTATIRENICLDPPPPPPPNASIPQGTTLGPVAFLAMINYFVSGTPEISHFKYVHDKSFVQTYRNNDQTTSMLQQLDCLQEWSTKNNMKLNPQKCQVMISCFQRWPPVAPCFQIGNSVINQTNYVKRLGIHLQENLKWDILKLITCAKLSTKNLIF